MFEKLFGAEMSIDVRDAGEGLSDQVTVIANLGDTAEEDYLASGERMRIAFALENGGKYAYYDGGSALMTYQGEDVDGGESAFQHALVSMGELRVALEGRNSVR